MKSVQLMTAAITFMAAFLPVKNSGIDLEIVLQMADFLKIPSSFVFYSGNQTISKQLLKETRASIMRKYLEVEEAESFIVDLRDINSTCIPKFKNLFPSVIILNSLNDLKAFPNVMRLDQELYFYLSREKSIYEKFTAGKDEQIRELANYTSGQFSYFVGIQGSVLERRGNFFGAELTTLVCEQVPYLNIAESEEDVEFLSLGDEMHEVIRQDRLSGAFHDMQVILERRLNFTSKYVKCGDDGGWGDLAEDGTFTGMVGLLNASKVDLIGTSLTMNPTRVTGVSYVHPMGVETNGLVIPKTAREEYGWSVFVDALSSQVWTVLTLNTFLCALLLGLMTLPLLNEPISIFNHLKVTLGFYWFSVSSYFGGVLSEELGEGRRASFKTAVFTVSFCGVWIWSVYRASLTSELSVRHTNMPFDDLEQLIESDYQMLVMRGTATEHVLRTSPEGSIYNRVYLKNFGTEEKREKFMVEDNDKNAMDFLLSGSENKPALFISLETAYSFKEYWCRFSVPWRSKYPALLSMATPKDSPYLPFLRHQVLKHEEIGSLLIMNSRWTPDYPQDCLTEMGRAMGKEKTITLFSIWAIGAVLSVVLMVAERLWGCFHETQELSSPVFEARKDRHFQSSFLSGEQDKIRSLLARIRETDEEDIDTFSLIYELEGLLAALRNKAKRNASTF